MSTHDAILSTIGAIYSAPGSNAGWRNLVEAVNDLTGARATVYVLVNKENLCNEIGALHGFNEADQSAYEGPNGAAKDVRFQYLHNLVPGQVFREFEYVTDREAWDNSEWIQYQRRALGCYWCMSARVSTHGLWEDFISVNRLEVKGPHTDREKADLQILLPHIARAAELHRTLTSLEQRYGAVLSVLNYLLVGLVIVDQFLNVVVANAAAREACESSGVVQLTRTRQLMAARPDKNETLQKLLRESIRTSAGSALGDGGRVVLGRGDKTILAEVMPLRDDGLAEREGIRGAAVFLIDPAVSKVASIDGIARIFQLTPSESVVADALANGRKVQEIAEIRNTSVDTVRKQLKAVFAKTGASSQLDLLRLAVKATPPIRK